MSAWLCKACGKLIPLYTHCLNCDAKQFEKQTKGRDNGENNG